MRTQEVGAGVVVRPRRQPLAGAEECGDGAAVFGHAAAAGFDDQAAQAGMQRVARDFLPERTIGAELMEQIFGVFYGGGRRSVEPFQGIKAADAGGLQEQSGGGEIFASDFRRVLGRTANEIVERVKADRAARAGASRTSGTLVGGGLADAADLQHGEPRPWRMAGDPRETAIDHGVHAFDGDGALGDVGGEDDLPAVAGCDSAVLLLGRLVAVKGEEEPAVPLGERGGSGLRSADFGAAGKKYQHVSLVAAGGCAFERGGNLLLEWRGGVRRVLDFERILAAFGAEDPGVPEVLSNGRGLQSGRHHDQAEVGAAGALEPAEQGEREVAFEVPLVEFIEDDGAGAIEKGVREEAAGEYAFSEEAQACARSGDFLEANLVADSFAGPLAEPGGDVAGGEARGQAAGLEHEDLAIAGIEEGGRNTGGLAGARAGPRGRDCWRRAGARQFRESANLWEAANYVVALENAAYATSLLGHGVCILRPAGVRATAVQRGRLPASRKVHELQHHAADGSQRGAPHLAGG